MSELILKSDLNLLNDRICNLSAGLATMPKNGTMQVNKAFLAAILGYMEELLGIWRAQPTAPQALERISVVESGVNPDGTIRYVCPNSQCGHLFWDRQYVTAYCPDCGQALSSDVPIYDDDRGHQEAGKGDSDGAAIEQLKISSAPASVLPKGAADTLTWVRSLDGYTDIGLRRGVTIDDAIRRLAELEGTLSASEGGGKIEAGILQGVPRHDLVGDNTAR